MVWRSHIPEVFDVLEDAVGRPHAVRAYAAQPPSAEWVKEQVRVRYRKEVSFGAWRRIPQPLAWEAPLVAVWSTKHRARTR